jgi:type I restriction enzyme S subunit
MSGVEEKSIGYAGVAANTELPQMHFSVMSESFPSDWNITTLRQTTGQKPDCFIDGDWIEAPHIRSDGIRLIQTGNIGIGRFIDKADDKKFISRDSFIELGCKFVYPNDILICRLAEPIGRACKVPQEVKEAITSVDVTIFRPDEERFNRDFLLHWLNSEKHLLECSLVAGGTNRSRISRSNLGEVLVPSPTKDEQSRIAILLNTLDDAIEKSEALIAKLKQVRAGMLHDLLTCGVDENGEIRDPIENPSLFANSANGYLPKLWNSACVGQLFEMQLGKMLNPQARRSNNPLPYLTNRHVQWGQVDCNNLEYMDFSSDERNKFRLRFDDLLVCEGGEVGRTAIWRDEIEECYFQKALHRLRPIDNRIIPDYMLVYMQRAAQTGQFLHLTVQTSIAHLPQEKLAQLKIILPPREEQEVMVEMWGAIDKEIKHHQKAHAKLCKTRSGLSSDLLTGQTRIPPNLELS